MDKIVIANKIDSILRCLNRIQQRLPETQAEFINDYDAQDVVVLNLIRAIQMNVDIATHILAHTNQSAPTTMAEAFTGLERLKVMLSSRTEGRDLSFVRVKISPFGSR